MNLPLHADEPAPNLDGISTLPAGAVVIESTPRTEDEEASLAALMGKVFAPPPRRSIESMLAECWHGRDWHRLSNLEGAIFDRLSDSGEMYHRHGFIYSARNSEIKTPD